MQEKRPRILVVGDVMLDHDCLGLAERISPEAPVPILRHQRDDYRLGGAAAVAAMCAALGAEVQLVGVAGRDSAAAILARLLHEAGVRNGIGSIADRPTTVKQRIIGIASGRHRQMLARIDSEVTEPLAVAASSGLFASLCWPETDLILISDYAKGLCTPAIVAACQARGVPILVDPPREGDWEKYHGVACLVPNRHEAGIVEADEARHVARALCRKYDLEAAVIKLDEEGALLADAEGVRRFPARVRTLHDVTGAGDQFLATLGYARARGCNWAAAVIEANVAAGLQCERHGCIPVTPEEVRGMRAEGLEIRDEKKPLFPLTPRP
jgi:D-beta-D-heptose 7-phosphate kinase/D-beta-D-heptose 1-phosphate adenosyltransferase